MAKFRFAVALAGPLMAWAGAASAQEGGGSGWFSGDWSLTIGAAGYIAPDYVGDEDIAFRASPIISFGRQGTIEKFSSRNDNISIGVFDNGTVRAGLAGKLIFERDGDTSDDLEGLDPVRFGGEIGAFAEVYPTDWLRVRGELRQGIRSHDGIVADVNVDAFYNVTPVIRVSAGPRISVASADYFDAYYGVDGGESTKSGLSQYDPGSGLRSIGVGGAIDWKTTDKITTSLFGEYARLGGPAANSSLVETRGSENQFTVGVSAAYRFDFTIP